MFSLQKYKINMTYCYNSKLSYFINRSMFCIKIDSKDKKLKYAVPTTVIAPTKKTLASPPQANPEHAPIAHNQQITKPGPPQKTPQELNMERLMKRWPENIQNPTNDINADIKNHLMGIYKWHLGDKAYHKIDDLPIDLYLMKLSCHLMIG